MAVTEKTFRRAELVSLVGLLLQVIGLVLVLLLGVANQAPSVRVESWHWLGGVPIWILLLVVFHQKRLEALEHLELGELRRQREQAGQTALFEVEAEDMLVASRRLKTILRYVMPTVTVLLAAYLVGMGALLWVAAGKGAQLNVENAVEIRYVRVSMALLAGLTFATFILSRMVVGVAKDSACRLLRAGGNYLTGNCFAALTLVGVLGLTDFGFRTPELIVAWVIPALMVVLGIELVLNLILEMYRPRMPGSEPRPVLESRLLGLISEPGDVARSIAEAMNYQFGFEISRTWFYQLLQRALGPLVLFQLGSLLALTVFVVVNPGQQALIERFGEFRGEKLQPGLHFKWPWPVERARIVDTGKIREVLLGTTPNENEEHHDEGAVVLWTAEHDEDEYDVLVSPPADAKYRVAASQPSTVDGDGRVNSVSVHLLRIVASLRYQVNDPVAYEYNYSNPGQVLLSTIQEAFLHFAASRDSDQLMTAERYKVNRELHDELANRIRQMDPPLGVELVDASLVGVHPPPAVATAYEQVGAGELIYAQMVGQARSYANARLSSLAGSSWLAKELSKAIDAADLATTSAQADAARKRLADLLSHTGGEVARIINAAEAERTSRENNSLADVAGFKAKLKAYNQAPHLFAAAEYLDALAKVLKPVRKYLIATSTGDRPFVVQFDMKDQGDLFGGLSAGKK